MSMVVSVSLNDSHNFVASSQLEISPRASTLRMSTVIDSVLGLSDVAGSVNQRVPRSNRERTDRPLVGHSVGARPYRFEGGYLEVVSRPCGSQTPRQLGGDMFGTTWPWSRSRTSTHVRAEFHDVGH